MALSKPQLTFTHNLLNCPPPEELQRFRQGKLPERLDADITHHLTFCRVCSTKLAILQRQSDQAISEPITLPAGLVEKIMKACR